VLVVEQHVHRVLEIADRVYVMQRGSVRFAGTAADARKDMDHIRDHYLSSGAVRE
jgi:branched-chain amino acid transport system ATP-binding protein